jgi:hypothetical protein
MVMQMTFLARSGRFLPSTKIGVSRRRIQSVALVLQVDLARDTVRGINMLKAVLVASALMMAAFVGSAPQASAAVQPHLSKATANVVSTVGWRHSGHRHFGHFHHRRHFGHFHRRGFVIGAPVYAYSYGGCGWLRHRALVTGSPYWWHRYRLCRRGW